MTALKSKIMHELTGKIRVLESDIGSYKTQAETLFQKVVKLDSNMRAMNKERDRLKLKVIRL
jgi:hypothetical protein